MSLLSIDPGTTESAFVVLDDDNRTIIDKDILDNEDMLDVVEEYGGKADRLAIEMVASYGMPVGKTTFETVLWIGRFIEAWQGPYQKIYRQDVKMHLCKTTSAKDSNIRQAILDLYPRSGGGATPQVGIKSKQGPLYGFKSHLWAALGVALTAAEYPDLDAPIKDAATHELLETT